MWKKGAYVRKSEAQVTGIVPRHEPPKKCGEENRAGANLLWCRLARVFKAPKKSFTRMC